MAVLSPELGRTQDKAGETDWFRPLHILCRDKNGSGAREGGYPSLIGNRLRFGVMLKAASPFSRPWPDILKPPNGVVVSTT